MVKRYRLDTECIIDMEEGKVLSMVQIRNKLNKLNDENEQLKNMVEHNYVEHKRCVNNYVDKIKEVEKENEQLKQSNKELLLLVDTLKEQNMKFKTRLNDLGVEYYD